MGSDLDKKFQIFNRLMLKFSYQLLWLVLLWSSPTVVTPLLSASVATTGAHTMLPPSSSASMLSPFTVLVAVESPSTSSRPRVSLYHLYTSSDADSLWGATYKLEQKTPVGFVSAFDNKLIRSIGVQNATDSTKVFLRRSFAILEENRLRHQEAMQKVASVEAEVAK